MKTYTYIPFFDMNSDDNSLRYLADNLNYFGKLGYSFSDVKHLGMKELPYDICFLEMSREETDKTSCDTTQIKRC